MSDDCDCDESDPYRIYCSLGDLELIVKESDPNRVEELFDDKWDDRMQEASELKEAIRDADRSHH